MRKLLVMAARIQSFALIECMFALPLQSDAAVAVAAAGNGKADDSKGGSYEVSEIWDAKSVAQAEASVLADCRENAGKKGRAENCRIVFSAAGPGYLAVMQDGGTSVGAALEADEAAAVAQAYADCIRKSATCNRSAVIVRHDTLGEKNTLESRGEITPAKAAAIGAQYPLPSATASKRK